MDLCTLKAPSLPGNSQYVIWADSTRLLIDPVAASASLTSGFGAYRAHWAGCRVDMTIQVTTNDATLVRQVFDGTAWQVAASGTHALTAGTLYSIGWAVETPDWRVYLLAGAAAPSAVTGTLMITRGDRASGSS